MICKNQLTTVVALWKINKMKTVALLVVVLALSFLPSCGREAKSLKEELRVVKEENQFLKAENIALKKEVEELYKKLEEKEKARAAHEASANTDAPKTENKKPSSPAKTSYPEKPAEKVKNPDFEKPR